MPQSLHRHMALPHPTNSAAALRLDSQFVLYVLTFLAVNLHILRNISSAYVVAPLLLYFLTFMHQSHGGTRVGRATSGSSHSLSLTTAAALAFLYGTVYMTVISPCYLKWDEVITATLRIWFALPLMILAAHSIRGELEVSRILYINTMFIVIGCLTLPAQMFTGSISWFVESSSRAGMDRFGSLFGNLTAIGCVGGLGLVMALVTPMSYLVRIVCCTVISGSMICSLQKAGVVNLVIPPAVFLVLGGVSLKTRVARVFSVFAPCCVGLLYLTLVDDRFFEYAGYISSKLGLAFGAQSLTVDDYGIAENLYERLVENIATLFDRYGWQGILCGVGAMGLGGTAGFPEYDMAHNTYGDLVFSGGVFYFLSFLALQGAIVTSLFRLKQLARLHRDEAMHTNICALLCMTLVFFVNLPANSGLLVQPNLCSQFYLTVGLVMGHYRRRALELGDIRAVSRFRRSGMPVGMPGKHRALSTMKFDVGRRGA